MSPTPECLTIDLEEWFCSHLEEVPEIGGYERWPEHPLRAHLIVPKLLDMLAHAGVTATFFVVGWYAERRPDVVRRVADAGHTIGCHTYAHRNLYHFDEAGLREDLRRGKAVLEDIAGRPVLSFRAPHFSIKRDNLWALRVLVEEGFRYDSSLFPTIRFDGGVPGLPLGPSRLEVDGCELLELPPSVMTVLGRRLPVFGGGYFRLAPDALVRLGRRQLARARRPAMYYFHPLDFDADQEIYPYRPLTRFRRYVRRGSLARRVRSLLDEGTWVDFSTYLDGLTFEAKAVDIGGVRVFPATASWPVAERA